MALDMLCQEMHEAWLSGGATERPVLAAREAFLSPWTGFDNKGKGCGERKKRWNVNGEPY